MGLTIISEDKLCLCCETPNRYIHDVRNLVLKIYKNSEECIATGKITAFTKYLVAGKIPNDIEYYNSKVILNLVGIPKEERSDYDQRILLVRKVPEIPISCMATEDDVYFLNENIVSLEKASDIFQGWLSSHGQYNVVDPPIFLSMARSQVASAFEVARRHFKENELDLRHSKFALGIENDEKGKPIPVWIKEGIVPSTSMILYNGEVIEDCNNYLIEIFLLKRKNK